MAESFSSERISSASRWTANTTQPISTGASTGATIMR